MPITVYCSNLAPIHYKTITIFESHDFLETKDRAEYVSHVFKFYITIEEHFSVFAKIYRALLTYKTTKSITNFHQIQINLNFWMTMQQDGLLALAYDC